MFVWVFGFGFVFILFFWFLLEDWGKEYLPPKLSAQNRVLIFNSDVAIGVEY